MDRLSAFLADVLGSPAALREALGASLPEEATRIARGRPVVLTGMGSSRFAALDVLPHLQAADLDARVELASALEPGSRDVETTLVAISNSGATPEVVGCAGRWPGPVVAITGRPASPLVEAADVTVELAGAREEAGIASLSYRAMMVALCRLLLPDVTDRLRAAVPAAEEVIAGHAAWLSPAASVLDGADELQVIGSARRQGTLEQAALMFREAPRIAALPLDAGDWLHVGLYTMLPGGRAVLLAGGPSDDEVVSTIAARGGSVVASGPAVAGATVNIPLPRGALDDGLVRSLVEPIVAELIAAELWGRTSSSPPGSGSGAGE